MLVMWDVEFTNEFGEWWQTMNEDEQDAVAFSVGLLESKGPSLQFPYTSNVRQSKHSLMRELRSPMQGIPIADLLCF